MKQFLCQSELKISFFWKPLIVKDNQQIVQKGKGREGP